MIYINFVFLCTEDGFPAINKLSNERVEWDKNTIEAFDGKKVFGRESFSYKQFQMCVGIHDVNETIFEFCERAVDILNSVGGIGVSNDYLTRNMVRVSRVGDKFGMMNTPPLLINNSAFSTITTASATTPSTAATKFWVHGQCKSIDLINKQVFLFVIGK